MFTHSRLWRPLEIRQHYDKKIGKVGSLSPILGTFLSFIWTQSVTFVTESYGSRMVGISPRQLRTSRNIRETQPDCNHDYYMSRWITLIRIKFVKLSWRYPVKRTWPGTFSCRINLDRVHILPNAKRICQDHVGSLSDICRIAFGI